MANLGQATAQRARIIYFWASWQPDGGQMDLVLEKLAEDLPIDLVKIEAEASPEMSSKYNIEVVPSFIFELQDGSIVDKLEGANPPEVAKRAEKLASASTNSEQKISSIQVEDAEAALNARLAELVRSSPVILFMKGTPGAPRCKFSRELTEILTEEAIDFSSFDILGDEEVRQGLKKFSNWPTYPQLYVRGELIGGVDIIKEMRESGLKEELGLENQGAGTAGGLNPPGSLEDRLRKLIGSARVMVFIKGTPEAPRCGFSKKIVKILQDESFDFSSFDILGDEEVRQGLKKFSNWPTYPQLYIGSELIGGLDIVEELRDAGELGSLK